MKIKDEFIELYRPRHVQLEAFQEAMKEGPVSLERKITVAEEASSPPQSLVDAYLQGDLRQIVQDFWMRPDHYSPRQHDILIAISTGQDPVQAATTAEKNELLLTWMRDTVTQKKTREMIKKKTEDIVLEDGRTLDEAVADEKPDPTYEAQDFGDKIII